MTVGDVRREAMRTRNTPERIGPMLRYDFATRKMVEGNMADGIGARMRAARNNSIMQEGLETDTMRDGQAILCARCEKNEAYGTEWPNVGLVCTGCWRALMAGS